MATKTKNKKVSEETTLLSKTGGPHWKLRPIDGGSDSPCEPHSGAGYFFVFVLKRSKLVEAVLIHAQKCVCASLCNDLMIKLLFTNKNNDK